MCIIIAKYKNNNTIPTKEQLKNCFEYNHDGAGFMYVYKNKVIIDKGFMEYNDFIKHYETLCKKFNNFKNKSLVIHCRIGTSSSNSKENTHPYPITSNIDELHNTFTCCNLGLAHNGIIHEYTPTDRNAKTNDTQEFVLKYIYNLYNNYSNFYKNKYILDGIQKITNSKFALLNNKDELYLIGDFVKEKGLYFSNTTYKTYTPTTKYYDYSNYWDKYLDDDFYYSSYYDKKQEEKQKEINFDDCIFLEDDDLIYFENTKTYQNAKDLFYLGDLLYNLETEELYCVCDGETELLSDNVIIYDKNYAEL